MAFTFYFEGVESSGIIQIYSMYKVFIVIWYLNGMDIWIVVKYVLNDFFVFFLSIGAG